MYSFPRVSSKLACLAAALVLLWCAAKMAAGATVMLSPGADPRPALAAGNSVTFGPGTGTYNYSFTLLPNETISGVDRNTTHLIFDLSAPGFGINATANGSAIEYLDITSNYGGIEVSGSTPTSQIVTQCGIQWDTSGQAVYPETDGIFVCNGNGATISLACTSNYFHDTQVGDMGLEFYYAGNSIISRNLFTNVHQGAQFVMPVGAINFDNNYATQLTRMMAECLGTITTSTASIFEASGDIAGQWANLDPIGNSMMLSAMNDYGIVAITNCQAYATMYDGAAIPAGKRFGYAFELGGNNGLNTTAPSIAGCTVVGPFVVGVSVSGKNAVITSDKFYGSAGWGAWISPEPDMNGAGNVASTTGCGTFALSSAPPFPANPGAGPTCMLSGVTPPPTPPTPPPTSIFPFTVPITQSLNGGTLTQHVTLQSTTQATVGP